MARKTQQDMIADLEARLEEAKAKVEERKRQTVASLTDQLKNIDEQEAKAHARFDTAHDAAVKTRDERLAALSKRRLKVEEELAALSEEEQG